MTIVTDDVLPQLLVRSAAGRGSRPAVVDGDRSLTYDDLVARSSQIARSLVAAGIGVGDRVAVYLEKSAAAVAAIFGILQSGAAYVPLDPHSPTARLATIVADCDVAAVVTDASRTEHGAELLAEGASPRLWLVLDGRDGQGPPGAALPVVVGAPTLDAAATAPLTCPASSDDLAYILYTSGSTGRPKGVMLTHRNALAFVRWAHDTFGVGDDDRVSSHAPFHFDLSVFDLYATAMAGATLVLVPSTASVFPSGIRRFIEDQAVTVWYSVPSVLTLLATRGGLATGDLASLRLVLFAGEVFPTKFLRSLMQLLPHARFANLYGPTETNVCTWYDVPALDPDQQEPIPIGWPIDGVDVFAVGEDGSPVAPGEPGELYVRGPTVALGYWGDPARSEQRFVPDPRRGVPGRDRCYRTGDLGRLQRDGTWAFLGRADSQVKSRGYRIELGEIETTLLAHEAVEECAVVAVADEAVSNRLHGFVVVRGELSGPELLGHCRHRLPTYMVPDSITLVATLPKTSTGKVDRRRLVDGVTGNTLGA